MDHAVGPSTRSLGHLRAVALIALVVGAVGSIGLMLRAGRTAPPLLIALIAIWVLSPFVALTVANVASRHWSVPMRTTLYAVMLMVSLGALAVYGADAVWPRTSQPAFVFVAVPPVSWLLMTLAVTTGAVISRRLSRHSQGA